MRQSNHFNNLSPSAYERRQRFDPSLSDSNGSASSSAVINSRSNSNRKHRGTAGRSQNLQ